MNKRITRKIMAAVAVATLFGGLMFAQVEATGDYTQYDANLLVPTTVEYVTVGATMGYYAVPDPTYHPAYVNGVGGPWTLTAGFTWAWTVPTEPAPGDATVAYPVATFPANYGRITYGATGNYVVNVAETAPAAFGGCADASPTVMNVTAIVAPTGTMSIAPAAPWVQIGVTPSYQTCSNQAAEPVTISFVENVPNALASYAFQVTETIENLNGANAVIATPQAQAVVQNFPLTSKVRTGNVGTLPAAAFNAATPNFSFVFNTDALDIVQVAGVDARTRYTYTVTRAGSALPATNFDFASNISHKSNYILGAGNELYYAFTNNTVSFIVNPAPATGPIYHISNTLRY